MIKLTYTDEMKKQDQLYETQNEDMEVMKRLHKSILAEAKEKGFNGVGDVIDYGSRDYGVVTELFETEEDYREEKEEGTETKVGSYGYCKYLVEELERLMNK